MGSRVRRAQLLLDARRYEESIAEVGQALAESPDNLSAQLVLAHALLGAGVGTWRHCAWLSGRFASAGTARAQTVMAQAATALRCFDCLPTGRRRRHAGSLRIGLARHYT